MSDTVKLRYSSGENISFRGTIDTGIPCEEWEQMLDSEKDEVIAERLFALVDIGEVEA